MLYTPFLTVYECVDWTYHNFFVYEAFHSGCTNNKLVNFKQGSCVLVILSSYKKTLVITIVFTVKNGALRYTLIGVIEWCCSNTPV